MRLTPTAKQRSLLLLPNREAFYGGSAGPGKSVGLLLGALQYVDQPKYDALIVRRNFSQLSKPNALIPYSRELLGPTDADYNAGLHQWSFPSGATLTFGHLATPSAIDDYQSSAFNYIAVDEVTDLKEHEYTFLATRLRRRTDSPIPSRIRSASNPRGPGVEWVKRRFVDEQTREPGVAFLPALPHENPHLDWDDYVESMRMQHPITWRRLLLGDWDVTDAGEMFQPRVWLGDGGILDSLPPGRYARVRYWDLAATEPNAENPDPDWTVGVRIARNLETGLYVIEHVVRARVTSGSVRKLVRATAREDGIETLVGIEQDPGQAGKDQVADYRESVLAGYRVLDGTGTSGRSKVERATGLAGAMENGRVVAVAGPWLSALWDELEGFPAGAHDDQVDALSGAYRMVRRRTSRKSGTGASARGPVRTR